MALGLYYFGLKHTSATFASNFLNLIPIATFILSVAFGYVEISLRPLCRLDFALKSTWVRPTLLIQATLLVRTIGEENILLRERVTEKEISSTPHGKIPLKFLLLLMTNGS